MPPEVIGQELTPPAAMILISAFRRYSKLRINMCRCIVIKQQIVHKIFLVRVRGSFLYLPVCMMHARSGMFRKFRSPSHLTKLLSEIQQRERGSFI